MKRSIVCAMVIFSLTGCNTVYAPPPKLASPPLVTYSKAQRLKAADELSKLPEDDILVRMLGDYGSLRDANRVRR